MTRASCIKVADDATDDETQRETSSRSQYAVREATTTATPSEAATNSGRKSMSPIVVKDPQRNSSQDFRPSPHLGEIEQPSTVIRMNPFNSVQHVKFENKVQLDPRRELFQDALQDGYQGISSILDEATRPSRIKFQDDVGQKVVTEYAGSSFVDDGNVKHVFVDQSFFRNVEKPVVEQDASSIFGKTMADQQLMSGTYLDTLRSPYVIGYYSDGDQNAHQPMSHETAYEIVKQPESGVLVLQQEESTYTRKRKFPYQFYQPSSEYHEVKYAEVPQHSTVAYPPMKKQPSIVLSKLRVADLPVEHKRATRLLDDQSATCEDRSICEMILAGNEPESNILQNILWNLATRISDDVATRNGLRQVLDAVKKKDCTTFTC
ncbi:hypothetical protein EAI_03543 [Harpegnathos saltator]|uniref:Uncharacterized protein n=1 Tax=Harpegnathos saltator TaxID=610380 RepID=E2C946_HARSA|nr:hypothetical protein EAI_03543 [Harpegnathos saltator]